MIFSAEAPDPRLDLDLRDVLDANLKAYSAVAHLYDATGAERAQALAWLDPLLRNANEFDPPISALDVGAGDGHFDGLLAKRGFVVTALDFCPEMADLIRVNAPSCRVVESEFLSFEFGNVRFDLVLLVAFVHLFPEPWDSWVIKKALSLLTARGLAFASTTVERDQDPGFRVKHPRVRDSLRYRNAYDIAKFAALIEGSGGRIVSLETAEDVRRPEKMWIDCIFRAA